LKNDVARVLHLYQAQLDIPDRFEIEWFKGPHRDQRREIVRIPRPIPEATAPCQ